MKPIPRLTDALYAALGALVILMVALAVLVFSLLQAVFRCAWWVFGLPLRLWGWLWTRA